MGERCDLLCPYRRTPDFPELEAACSGVRIDLADEPGVLTNEAGQVIGEAPRFACGSPEGPDRERPSISQQDYIDTPLPVRALRRLWERGLLPEQGTGHE